jgi:hypothetical protein
MRLRNIIKIFSPLLTKERRTQGVSLKEVLTALEEDTINEGEIRITVDIALFSSFIVPNILFFMNVCKICYSFQGWKL